MAERYGIVYLGSKEKILHLIRYIFEREYKKKFFIDMFCGGFSVTSFALQNSRFNVLANDLNKYVVALYKTILGQNTALKTDLDKAKYIWVSREKFNDVRDNPDKYSDWYVGYVLNIWSFGCNQNDYLYAKEIEEDKHALHEAIVNDDFSLIKKNPLFNGFYIPKTIREIDYKVHPTKRIAFMAKFKKFISDANDARVAHLERLEQLENLSQMEHLNSINRNIPFKDRLQLFAMDWKDFYNSLSPDILKDAFFYCDPPYEGTKQYQFGRDFDYEEFWQWFRECPYPVYASSYQAPDDIKPINFDLKAQLLDNGHRGDNKPKKKVFENIYWNGKGNAEPTFMDLLFPND